VDQWECRRRYTKPCFVQEKNSLYKIRQLCVFHTQFLYIQDDRKTRAGKFDVYYQLVIIAMELNWRMNMLV
jgi:hypothetical protein